VVALLLPFAATLYPINEMGILFGFENVDTVAPLQ
jgi:hypothetical protein